MTKHNILIMGAGNIGTTVAGLLAQSGDYKSYIGDINQPHAIPQIQDNQIEFIHANIKEPNKIKEFIKANSIHGIVSCLPFNLTLEVANIASECGIHYFDPTEDVATTTAVNLLAEKSIGTFAPQCGLAPGFISIAANSLMDGFDDVEHVKMRVGALTQNTSNPLHYAFTWSVDGVVNEYIHPCVVIESGQRKLTPALGGLETIIVDNNTYEAFHTSGGVGSMVETYAGRVKNMDYKTMRYQGHCQKMQFFLYWASHCKLGTYPTLAKKILSKVIPYAQQDKVVIYVSVQGYKNGKLHEVNYTNTLFPVNYGGHVYSAIQMTTAAGICAVVDMVVHEKRFTGLVKQEQISLVDFINNRFGVYYASLTKGATNGAK